MSDQQQPTPDQARQDQLKADLLSLLYRYQSGLETADAPEAMVFEDLHSSLKGGDMSMAEVLHDLVQQFNERNGNMDIAIDFLQVFTGESEDMEKYRYFNR